MYGLSIRSKGTMANSSRLGTSGFTRTTMLYYVSAMLALGFIAGVESFNLTIVHNNDVHAHFEQINKYSGECADKDANEDKCFGGEARRVTIIKEYRANYNNTLVLDAGDRFTGTLWFTQYKGEAASRFVNLEQYDAVCLGNHEFDLGVEGLVPYLDNLTVPVLDANIDVSNEPRLQGKFNKTMVLTIGGERVGIVGFITKQTAFISSADPTVTFQDELETVRAEVEKLRNAGVKVIVGLSHAGYGIDKMVAAQVDGIDVIVGGHSHTFLYSGTPPSNEEIEGPYPTIITGPSGQKVLIVQAYAWGKYMGVLQVAFDDNGDVQSWAGNPVLLDNNIQQDPETLKIIEEMKKPLIKIKQQIVGRTAVRMEGDPIQCRLRECNSGNLLTDAMVEYHIDKRESNDTWALAAIALLSGGGIRASTEIGNISMGQVLTVTPFGNNVDMIQIRGVHLRQAFEHSVANYDVHDRPGAFFQMSGAHVVYDLSKPSGSRVVSLEVLCLRCSVPVYSPLVDTEVYNVLMVDFTIKGGDGFTMITNNIVRQVSINSLDSDVFSAYLHRHNPVFPVTEGRIKFVQSGDVSSSPPLTSSMCSYMSLYIFMYAFLIFVR